MFRVRDFFGFVGVALFLVAMYLVLVRADAAAKIGAVATNGGVQILRTLQGR